MTHYVYIIEAKHAIKVGFTDDVDRRLAELQTGSPTRLRVMARFPVESEGAARTLEREMHDQLAPYHLHGEWFQRSALKYVLRPELRGKRRKISRGFWLRAEVMRP